MLKRVVAICIGLAVLGGASVGWAVNPAGTYTYREKGYKGTMVIEQMGPGFTFVFKTTSTSNGQECDFQTYETPVDQGGGREDDALPAKGGTEDDGIKFAIAFKGNEAMADVESRGGECGMSGNFGGKYLKKSK